MRLRLDEHEVERRALAGAEVDLPDQSVAAGELDQSLRVDEERLKRRHGIRVRPGAGGKGDRVPAEHVWILGDCEARARVNAPAVDAAVGAAGDDLVEPGSRRPHRTRRAL